MTTIKCIIIDDEPSSQDILETFIKRVEYLELIAIFSSAVEAMSFLKEQAIDLMFLDINMPELSGLTFYKSLQNPPKVIFATAYTEHAVEGFELSAVDYLLKPFSFERFLKAIAKVNPVIEKPTEHMLIKADKRLHQVKIDEIKYLESIGDYVKVHLLDSTLITYTTLKKIHQELPSSVFLKVHKSYIVNTNRIEYVEGNMIHIADNEIPIGASYKEDFQEKWRG